MKIIEKLEILTSSVWVFNQKLYNIHFNTQGNMFWDIHKMTEELYDKTTDLYDELGEKIAMFEKVVKASFNEHLTISNISDIPGKKFTGEEAVKIIVSDLEEIIRTTKEVPGGEEYPTVQPLLDEIFLMADKYKWLFSSLLQN
ncbi:MAG: hypothetical protein NC236_00145 [Mycoplasma sp.]|nr:hypothetical protein [Mycoplasma sp.]